MWNWHLVVMVIHPPFLTCMELSTVESVGKLLDIRTDPVVFVDFGTPAGSESRMDHRCPMPTRGSASN